MATATKICKVCGKEYPYCKTVFKPGVFRYQDVACSPEHGAIYLAKVEAARTIPQEENTNDAIESSKSFDDIQNLIELILADVDEDYEEDDYDDEEEEDEE